MGKKRIVRKAGSELDQSLKARSLAKAAKRKLERGILYVQSTFNNTRVLLTDETGGVVASSSSGALGFTGAKKGTPFAAAKIGELVGERAALMGIKEVSVVVRGVGAGRESAIRAFSSKGIQISAIRDTTPVPHNGPRPPKPRRI